MFDILGDVPYLVFTRHFINLFTEFPEKIIATAIMDLLFAYGSGYTKSTLTESEIDIGVENKLCRTSQLLISIALAMTRQVLYKYKLNKKIPERMTMD